MIRYLNRKGQWIWHLLVIVILSSMLLFIVLDQTPKAQFDHASTSLERVDFSLTQINERLRDYEEELKSLEEEGTDNDSKAIADLEYLIDLDSTFKNHLVIMVTNLRSAIWELGQHSAFTTAYLESMKNFYQESQKLYESLPSNEFFTVLLGIELNKVPYKVMELDKAIQNQFTSTQYQWYMMGRGLTNLFSSSIPIITILASMIGVNLLYERKRTVYGFIPANYKSQLISYFGQRILWIPLSFLIIWLFGYILLAILTGSFEPLVQGVFLSYLGQVIELPIILVNFSFIVIYTLIGVFSLLVIDLLHRFISNEVTAMIISIILVLATTQGVMYFNQIFLSGSLEAGQSPSLFIQTFSLDKLANSAGEVTSVQIQLLAILYLALIVLGIGYLHYRQWKWRDSE